VTPMLPPGQHRIWQALLATSLQGRSPNLAELARQLGLSRSVVVRQLAALERKGWLELHRRGRRFEVGIRLTPVGLAQSGQGIPVLGSIAAGPLGTPDTEFRGLIPIPNQHGLFGLFVGSDSMSERFMPGDLVLLRPGLKPRKGQVAAIYHQGETTLKYVEPHGHKVFLVPHNPDYPLIELPANDLVVQAVHEPDDGLIRGKHLIAAILEGVDM
jgi:repressor LexA